MDNLSKFAERLSELMFDAKIKSELLGAAIGVSGSAIRRWLRGSGVINLTNLVTLADYFRCSIDYLVGKTENYITITPKPLPPFSKQIRKVLEEKGLSRYAMTKNTKFKDKYFWKWDKGTIPMLPNILELADILDCSIDYLVGRE